LNSTPNRPPRSYFFYELHILTLPLALLLLLRGRVFVFRYRGFCKIFLKKDWFESIGDFKNVDQWQQKREDVHRVIKKYFAGHSDLLGERLFIQQLCIDYEAYVFFITLINNHSGPKTIIDTFFRSFIKNNHSDLLTPLEQNVAVIKTAVLDSFFSSFVKIYEILKLFYRLFSKTTKATLLNTHYKYICTGISAAEYYEKHYDLDFSWLVTNEVLDGQDVLYILDARPSEKSAKRLHSLGVHFVTKDEVLGALPWQRKILIACSLLRFVGLSFFSRNYRNQYHLNSELHSGVWTEILKPFAPSFFLYSFSQGWPETYAAISCRELGIKTAMWLYSAGEFLYATHLKTFSDLSIRFSIFQADELWVWNEAVKDLFISRLLHAPDATKIHVVGPVLNADWAPLKRPRQASRPFTVSVFDLTPMKEKMRLNFAEGPFCNKELQELFYQGIRLAHALLPDVYFIIKTKRHFDPDMYDEVPSLKYFLDTKLERIEFLEANVSPYFAIAESDLAISTPLTSPSMLALAFGKPGVYFDPLGLCNYSFKNIFTPLTLKNDDELINFIKKCQGKDPDLLNLESSVFTPISIDTIVKLLKERLGQTS
jgi:polysaccharide biosynthesis PFTS motif protein